jgi:hypothetical protein
MLVEFGEGIEAFIGVTILKDIGREEYIRNWHGKGVIVNNKNKLEMKHYKIYNVGEIIVTKIWIDTSNVIPMMKFEFEGNGRINLN